MNQTRRALNLEERLLLEPLLSLLKRTRRIRSTTRLLSEFAWHGRRIDLVTATGSGIISAFELKLGNAGRVLEQATYNALSFDRSWVVVDRVPLPRNIGDASAEGIGVIVVQEGEARVLVPARRTLRDQALRRRLVRRVADGMETRV